MTEFATGEPGLVFPEEGQPSVVHLDDGAEVEVEALASSDPYHCRVCPETVHDFGAW